MKKNFYNCGQSLIGIIIVLVMVSLISGGLYYYLSKQIPEVPEITKKSAEEEVVKPEVAPEEEIIPPREEIPPEEVKPEITCQNECSQAGLKRCSNNGYQICGNYDADDCVEWSLITNCPPNTTCQNGNCAQQKCADGTLYGQCSTDKPKYCDSGALINKCSFCSCPLNLYCNKSSELCETPDKFEMLIFISPQYANDIRIKEAINTYTKAVKEDINWNTKVLTLTSGNNDFRKIDEIIESYYKSDGVKAAIMVGEDINTPLGTESLDGIESPSITPWSSLKEYRLKDGQIVGTGEPVTIDIVVSLLYPVHTLDYERKSNQLVEVFKKFSKDRNKKYSKKSLAFLYSEPAAQIPFEGQGYKTLSNYSNLTYKENPIRKEVSDSLEDSYMIYSVHGHANPGSVDLSSLPPVEVGGVEIGAGFFTTGDISSLNTPVFTGQGCNVEGWYSTWPPNDSLYNQKLDPPASSYFGSEIFTNPNLRVLVLGFPDQVCFGQIDLDFFGQVIPDMMAGKTLTEALQGDKLCYPEDSTIYGDPTFHYNF